MSEIILNANHIEDAAGTLAEAATSAFSANDREVFYRPDHSDLPRPSYGVFEALATAQGLPAALAKCENLRVMAGVQTRDRKTVYLPGVVLRPKDGRISLACLTTDSVTSENALSRPFSAMQQTLLDNMYIMQKSDPSHNGTSMNAAEIGHGALIAASPTPVGIHGAVHTLAGGGTFAQTFSNEGYMDIGRGHDTRQVRPVILGLRQLADLRVYSEHQLTEPNMLGISLKAGELAIGVILAAAETRNVRTPLIQNLTAIAEQKV